MASSPTVPAAEQESWLEVTSSRHFPAWLAENHASIAFTTYQAGKLFLVGTQHDGRTSVFERTFNRCMGMAADGATLWISSLFQLWRLENALRPGERYKESDALYVPRIGYTTGDLDIHDIAVDITGRPVFVNTLFGCLATVSSRYSFTPLWKPPFISKLAAEDRCHLNGLAMANGFPRFVTAASTSDVVDGWRERRRDGGCVVDVESNQIIASGLSMPHSPRWHRDKLWVHNSGTGFFGVIDIIRGTFEPVTFCPGYLRGLAFLGDHAVVGLSRPRRDKTFSGLKLDDELQSRSAEPWCGIQIINLRTGDAEHWLRLGGLVSELYDVAILPGVLRPAALGFKSDDIQRTLAIGDPGDL